MRQFWSELAELGVQDLLYQVPEYAIIISAIKIVCAQENAIINVIKKTFELDQFGQKRSKLS
jgi:hypothetical protein